MTEFNYLSKSARLTNYSVIPNDLFSLGLSSTAIVLYAKMLNRANLSISNGIADEQGRIYIYYRLEDLAKELNRSVTAVKTNMKELVKAGLVEKRRADTGRANMIFIKIPETSLTGGKPTVYRAENKPYNSLKTGCARGGFSPANNNKNNINNNFKNNCEKKTDYIYGEDTF